ncbi:DinB family protein [Flavobacterium sp.]|uniref:DinB family protein n=1 Tax=Flavobacterium sp. TaxID=239 RepID=UPI003A8C9309
MKVTELSNTEYAPYYETYLPNIDDTYTLTEWLEVSVHEFVHFIQDIPMDKHGYRYAEDKWTIKEIIQHVIDTERVFAYRALRISRNDKTPLPGFDENDYVSNTDAENRSLQDILTELALVRQSSLVMFKSFSQDQLLRRGEASGHEVSVRALAFLITAHQYHHMKIFKERYLE